jgi:hypothetical protein
MQWPSLPPRKYYWYSILLEASVDPMAIVLLEGYVNEKFQLHNQESNP